jgi:transcriptional regulator with XRE-family HTH domain
MSTMKERIRAKREEIGLMQREVAKLMEMSRAAITQWEVGLTQPNYESLIQLARILKTTPQWLAFGVSEKPVEVLPEDLFFIPLVRPGEKAGELEVVGRTAMLKSILSGYHIALVEGNVVMLEMESAAFTGQLNPGDRLLIDRNITKVTGDGFYLINNGLTCTVVNVEVRGGDKPVLVVHSSNRPDSTYEVRPDKLKVMGKVRAYTRFIG